MLLCAFVCYIEHEFHLFIIILWLMYIYCPSSTCSVICTCMPTASLLFYCNSAIPPSPPPLSLVGQSLGEADGDEEWSEGDQAHRPQLPQDTGECHPSWHPCVARGSGGDAGSLPGTCPIEANIHPGKAPYGQLFCVGCF